MPSIDQDFVGYFVDEFSKSTDADLDYIELSALVLASTCMGRGLSVPFGVDDIYPNLWVALVGVSSESRKSTCVKFVKRILLNVNSKRLFSENTSPEAFLDQMLEYPEGAMVVGELVRLTDSFRRDYMQTFHSDLLDIYDNPDTWSRVRTKKAKRKGDDSPGVTDGGKSVVVAPYLSIFGGITPETIEENVKRHEVTGGFYPRFLFSLYREEASREEMVNPPVLSTSFVNSVISFLKSRIEVPCNYLRCNPVEDGMDGSKTLRGKYSVSEEAMALHSQTVEAWKEKFKDSSFMGPFIARGGVYLNKIALIYSALEGAIGCFSTKVIQTEHMERSVRIVNRCLNGAADLFIYSMARSRDEKDLGRVLRIIETSDGPMCRRRLLQRTGFLVRRFDEIAQTLFQQGKIKSYTRKNNGAAASVVFEVNKNGEHNGEGRV